MKVNEFMNLLKFQSYNPCLELYRVFMAYALYPIQNQLTTMNVPKRENSQIEGPSICNSYGFKVSMQNLQEAKALHEVGSSFDCVLVRTAFIKLSD